MIINTVYFLYIIPTPIINKCNSQKLKVEGGSGRDYAILLPGGVVGLDYGGGGGKNANQIYKRQLFQLNDEITRTFQ